MEETMSRVLTEEELLLLQKQNERIVSEFKQEKLEKEACKSWDLFYKRNETNFYKDRHWTFREFYELLPESLNSKQLLEVGCGVGNFVFPLVKETSDDTFFQVCDFSPRAIDFVKKNPNYDETRMNAFCCDITNSNLPGLLLRGPVDVVSLIFVLSAIHPDKMEDALRNIHGALKKGGCVLFRDYGNNDHAMLRFAPGSKLGDRFYVRQDNTRAYYFRLEEIREMFESCGFGVVRLAYIHRDTINKKEDICVPRIFTQGVFVKE